MTIDKNRQMTRGYIVKCVALQNDMLDDEIESTSGGSATLQNVASVGRDNRWRSDPNVEENENGASISWPQPPKGLPQIVVSALRCAIQPCRYPEYVFVEAPIEESSVIFVGVSPQDQITRRIR